MTGRISAAGKSLPLLILLALLGPAIPGSDAPAAELPDLEVTDLWDYSESLSGIVGEGMTLFFICDPQVKECREGAVFIENRAPSIREAGVRPVLLLRGSGPAVRNAALEMDLNTPIYIDGDGRVMDSMLDQDILPALLLVSHDGTIIETVYGGGESLAGNLERILMRAAPEPPRQVVAAPEAGPGKKSRAWKILVGAAVLITIGVFALAR